MTREMEVRDYLRGDEPLDELAPGGIYADSELSVEGISEAAGMPDVWLNNVFQTTIVVRERAAVPTGDLQSTRTQRTSMSQVIEVWVYGLTSEAVQAALDRVYALLMGKRLAKAFSATWVGGSPLIPAPELPSGTFTRHEDYRIVTIRRPVTA